MNYFVSTGKTIEQSFNEFDRANPMVYEYFKRFLRDVVKAGKKRTSAKMIFNRIRWEVDIVTKSTDDFKINDAFISRYVRKFTGEHPDYAYLFETRRLQS